MGLTSLRLCFHSRGRSPGCAAFGRCRQSLSFGCAVVGLPHRYAASPFAFACARDDSAHERLVSLLPVHFSISRCTDCVVFLCRTFCQNCAFLLVLFSYFSFSTHSFSLHPSPASNSVCFLLLTLCIFSGSRSFSSISFHPFFFLPAFSLAKS